MSPTTADARPPHRRALPWLLRAGVVFLLVGGGAAVFRGWAGAESPSRMAADLRTEVPVGAGWDRLSTWLLRNGLTGWTDYPGRPPGVVVPPGGSIVLVELPGSAGRDSHLRPLRLVVYVVFDGNDINDESFKVHGHFVETVPEPSELERLRRRLGL